MIRLFRSNKTTFLHIKHSENSTLTYNQRFENLYLSWSSSFSNDDDDDERIDRSVNHGMVLEGLQLHPNLKMLSISDFEGSKLPKWMGSCHSLPNLVELYFKNCNTCEQLPALGMLPSLRILRIEGMNSVQSLGQEFYYSQQETSRSSNDGEIEETNTEICVFPSLVELRLVDMSNLEEWAATPHSFKSFPSLKRLIVNGCLRLKSIPFISCSSVKSLELGNTNDEAVNSILASTGVELLTSLESVTIYSSPQLKYFPVVLLPTRIQSLRIGNCSNFQGFRNLDNEELQAQVSSDTGFNTSISSLLVEVI